MSAPCPPLCPPLCPPVPGGALDDRHPRGARLGHPPARRAHRPRLVPVLIAAVKGQAVHWCIGGRTAPYAAHAWIETDTGPAGEPASDRPYVLLLRI
nr:lasso peptide biosynthesis protein [Nonomuraea candida]